MNSIEKLRVSHYSSWVSASCSTKHNDKSDYQMVVRVADIPLFCVHNYQYPSVDRGSSLVWNGEPIGEEIATAYLCSLADTEPVSERFGHPGASRPLNSWPAPARITSTTTLPANPRPR
jgi:hypothetical protein